MLRRPASSRARKWRTTWTPTRRRCSRTRSAPRWPDFPANAEIVQFASALQFQVGRFDAAIGVREARAGARSWKSTALAHLAAMSAVMAERYLPKPARCWTGWSRCSRSPPDPTGLRVASYPGRGGRRGRATDASGGAKSPAFTRLPRPWGAGLARGGSSTRLSAASFWERPWRASMASRPGRAAARRRPPRLRGRQRRRSPVGRLALEAALPALEAHAWGSRIHTGPSSGAAALSRLGRHDKALIEAAVGAAS